MKMQTFDQYSFHFMSKSEHQNSKNSKKIEVIDESDMKKKIKRAKLLMNQKYKKCVIF